MSRKSLASSSKTYSRPVKRTNLKLLVFIIFLTAVLHVSGVHFLPEVSAQQVKKIGRKKGIAEQQILTEIRIAKDFIGKQEWEKASFKLAGVIRNFPQNSRLDIAYYWLAYTFFQQEKFSEGERTIAILQREFPHSAWTVESKSLTVEINSRDGRRVSLTSEEFSKSDDEIKAFAIQNMLKTARPKAMSVIDEILGSTGKATGKLKESILILLFDDKSDWATDNFIQVIKTEKNENLLKQALIGLKKRNEKKILPVLHDFLRQNTNENLLDAALYTVSGISSESANTTLVYFAKNGGNKELRQKSIIWLGNIGSKSAIEELRVLYGFFSEFELKQQVQISLSEINTTESLQVLINLIESETNKDLIEHGIEMLKLKTEPLVLKYLEKKLRTKIIFR